jgi:putative hydroxymethylpyrimidine transport system ATP-binding protein
VELPNDRPEPDTAASARGLVVRGLELAWGARVLVHELAIEAAPGSWTCLLGESGVGKTTLLRTIAGLEPVRASGHVATDRGDPTAGLAAYMAQQDLLLPWLTATQNVALGARLRGERPDFPRALELLTHAGVADRAEARPAELSGGERQRVALARTLMEDRPIVLMDEPFSALDAITRTRLQDLARNLLAGRTVLMVTHDPFEALRLADEIHVLKRGKNTQEQIIRPSGPAPRDPADPALREAYTAVMNRLALQPDENDTQGDMP